MAWRKLIRRVSSSQYLRNIATLLSGNSGATMITVISTVVLARVYVPSDFGLFALFVSTSTIVAVLASGKYESTIMLPKRTKEAYQILLLCCILLSAVAIVVFLLMLLGGNLISGFLPKAVYFESEYFLPVSIFLLGLIQIFNSWFTRGRSFGVISTGKILNALFTGLTSLVLGVVLEIQGGLILGFVIGMAVTNLFLLANFMYSIEGLSLRPDFALLRTLAKEYADFPLFGFLSDGLNTISKEAPNYILSIYFGSATVGYYNMALRLLNLPKVIISLTIGEVYYEKASRSVNKGHSALTSITRRTFYLLGAFSFGTLLPIFFFADFIFPMAFGEGWGPSADYSRLLAPWMLVWFISSPLAYIFYVKRKLNVLFVFQIVTFIARIAAVYLGALTGSDSLTILCFSLANFLIDSVMIFVILKLSGSKTNGLTDQE